MAFWDNKILPYKSACTQFSVIEIYGNTHKLYEFFSVYFELSWEVYYLTVLICQDLS